MGMHGRRALTVMVVACVAAGAGAGTASADTWTGSTHGKVLRSNRLLNGGSSWHGDFWFRTDRRGGVHGYAVIAYEPVVDVSGITNAVGYIRSFGSTALGLLGPYGAAVSGSVLSQIVGASVTFKQAAAIRRAPLTGQLSGRRLTLRWKKPAGVKYDINFVLATGSKRIGGGTAGLRNPFGTTGDRLDGSGAVYSSQRRSKEDGVTESFGSYWIATRVG
jgi:hypothetical protein